MHESQVKSKAEVEALPEEETKVVKPTKKHYIDNEAFAQALIDYKSACENAKKGVDTPIPDYIGECFLKIATNLSRSPKFINYSYRDEMIMDGVENCLTYFRNFDPTFIGRTGKSRNAFNYFTQIIYHAFVRRINKENKESYVKYKSAQSEMIFHDRHDAFDEDSHNLNGQHDMLYNNIEGYIADFEAKMEAKKEKKRLAKKEKMS
jgi:hypothetical protein